MQEDVSVAIIFGSYSIMVGGTGLSTEQARRLAYLLEEAATAIDKCAKKDDNDD